MGQIAVPSPGRILPSPRFSESLKKTLRKLQNLLNGCRILGASEREHQGRNSVCRRFTQWGLFLLSLQTDMAMKMALRRPTAELVNAACDKFDLDNFVIEEALNELFNQYQGNGSLPQVLLKVVSLNRLYSTQILAVMDVARHIHQNAKEIDFGLPTGSPLVVETIGKVTIGITGKERYNYSFATKYCSWHNPTAYPIWDSRVDKYLWRLQKQDNFAPFFKTNADMWDYPKFVEVMTAFRKVYGLESFTFKETDKFLWSEQIPINEPPAEVEKLVGE